ncbi:hypothetical protein GUITHDRAFT_105568 [Guillardia theta CCMP2712]|uniref:Uncharacterized protein n=2 Tax=Guillardia theta TaxID=55529 RepID=L1JKC5_GUITC|nr:hypothetical protein GUITHDRAFT_105568 [Guillardia theta CCMP2712]EKX48941.1 hypothetical protein GUITHDRAFT_105568 [Guillardia theta CCMP2712]|eukprot:XP_005835921.1 hypothetical protein GUITHDRAFT_105568 [Guillardia theta CCMP2712]
MPATSRARKSANVVTEQVEQVEQVKEIVAKKTTKAPKTALANVTNVKEQKEEIKEQKPKAGKGKKEAEKAPKEEAPKQPEKEAPKATDNNKPMSIEVTKDGLVYHYNGGTFFYPGNFTVSAPAAAQEIIDNEPAHEVKQEEVPELETLMASSKLAAEPQEEAKGKKGKKKGPKN